MLDSAFLKRENCLFKAFLYCLALMCSCCFVVNNRSRTNISKLVEYILEDPVRQTHVKIDSFFVIFTPQIRSNIAPEVSTQTLGNQLSKYTLTLVQTKQAIISCDIMRNTSEYNRYKNNIML